MKIAITGGTGFVGRHLAQALLREGHEVMLLTRGEDRRDLTILSSSRVSFTTADLGDVGKLARAFAGCAAVAHCAGVNREIGAQTFARVHVAGTANVVAAARQAGVGKLVLLSFLRPAPPAARRTMNRSGRRKRSSATPQWITPSSRQV